MSTALEIVGLAASEIPQSLGLLATELNHLKFVCGYPGPEMEREIVWKEHELGSNPMIALTWEDGMRAPRKCGCHGAPILLPCLPGWSLREALPNPLESP